MKGTCWQAAPERKKMGRQARTRSWEVLFAKLRSLNIIRKQEVKQAFQLGKRSFSEIYLLRLSQVLNGEGNGTPLQYSCLENPMDGRAWWAAVHGVTKSRTQLSNFTFAFHFHALEKKMATHSNVLAWRIPGTGEPGGLPSMGSHRVGHDWSDSAAVAAAHSEVSSLVAQKVKNLPAMWEIWVQSLGWEDPLENGMATHSSTLAWRIPWTEAPNRLQFMGSQRVRHHCATNNMHYDIGFILN